MITNFKIFENDTEDMLKTYHNKYLSGEVKESPTNNNFYILEPPGATVLNIVSAHVAETGYENKTYILKGHYKYLHGEMKESPTVEIEFGHDVLDEWTVYGPSTLKDVLEIAPTLKDIDKYNL